MLEPEARGVGPGPVEDLLSVLNGRLQRLSETKDTAVVLDSAALDEARRLWSAAVATAGDPYRVPVDVLTAVAYLHWYRYQYLPQGQDQDDMRKTSELFGLLMDRVPERVPDQVT